MQDSPWCHAGIKIHVGKTKVWNKAGVRSQICNVLEDGTRQGPKCPGLERVRSAFCRTRSQDLGCAVGHQDYVRRFLNEVSEKHQILFQRIPRLSDVQSAWLLLVHCARARANYTLRCIDPEAVEAFARRHDQDMFACRGVQNERSDKASQVCGRLARQ